LSITRSFRINNYSKMKKTIPFAAFAMLGLSLSPIHAADTATTEKPASAQAAADKVPVYVIVVSGKG